MDSPIDLKGVIMGAKNSIKKTNTSSKVKDESVIIEDKKTETIKVEPVPTYKEFVPHELINTTSVTAGEMLMIGAKTKTIYRWADIGDTCEVEFQDLKAEKYNTKSRYIYDPLFVIENEDVLALPEFKKVAEVYQNMLSVEDVENIFNLDAMSFKRTIENLPKGLKNTIKVMAVTKIEDGSLDSIQKIKIIDSVLGTDLFNSYLSEN